MSEYTCPFDGCTSVFLSQRQYHSHLLTCRFSFPGDSDTPTSGCDQSKVTNACNETRVTDPVGKGDTPKRAPEGCPCFDETDCSRVDICNAVYELYR